MRFYSKITVLLVLLSSIASCKKDETPATPQVSEPQLIFKFKFDPTQTRLDNFGNPSSMPSGNAGQSPTFHKIGAHYIEFTQSANVKVGEGKVVYDGPYSNFNGVKAIDFEKEKLVGEGEAFLSIPIKSLAPGTYEYLRVSLAYQNYDVNLKANGLNMSGTLSSFVGFKTYIKSFKPDDSTVVVNDNKDQGYWAFETAYNVTKGQAPKTTVPNPINASSPLPPGSCLVTGKFNQSFTVTGNETKDIVITISLSTNNSFEWQDINPNGIWEPLDGENVVRYGLKRSGSFGGE